ncbi:MAG TPA: TIGR03790 family protein, partial [Pyrinomonadaceae bacterium]|nr:TIGR03790 family protein [Pyrinomonadaceae bacterium]
MLRPSSHARLRLLSALALFVAALAGLPAVRRASAVDPSTPLNQRVLVVYNSNSPESLEVAEHYIARRQIPASHKCAVAPPGTGFVSWADYLSTVRAPIRDCLNAVGPDEILYVVFSYQTPFEIDNVPTARGPELRALDQFVADIWDEFLTDNGEVFEDHPYHAPARSQNNLFPAFVSLAEYRAAPGAKRIYSVWRLDAPSAALAKGLVDKALEAEANGLQGRACFDRNRGPVFGLLDEGILAGDWELHRAADLTRRAGLTTVEDENAEEFGTAPAPARCDDAALYAGWYSFNNYNDAFTWNTGAVGFHLDSASAIHPREGTNWSANALSRGITVTSGSVTEPFLEGMTRADGVFRDLLAGANVGDAFLRNTAWLKWVMLNVGDPL